jgi:hypothetical protein
MCFDSRGLFVLQSGACGIGHFLKSFGDVNGPAEGIGVEYLYIGRRLPATARDLKKQYCQGI